ncbi:hypothetical protein CLAIMM_00384 [Cladophialophora immunda]|nr:hypothetical protein CLAIMM_00384 [Cladophialophora immunda]
MLPSQEQASSARRVGLRVSEAWATLPRCPWSSSGPVPVVDMAATLVQMSDSNPHVNRHDGCFPTNHEPRATCCSPVLSCPQRESTRSSQEESQLLVPDSPGCAARMVGSLAFSGCVNSNTGRKQADWIMDKNMMVFIVTTTARCEHR